MEFNEYVDVHEQEMMQALKNTLDNIKGTFITLQTLHKALEGLYAAMPAYLVSPRGRMAFRKCIDNLLAETLLVPVGRKPGTTDGLFSKYRVKVKAKEKEDGLVEQILESIAPPAKVEYYLKNPDDWVVDKEAIITISGFLSEKGTDFVTVNERSYELFGDEKFLTGAERERSRGAAILSRLGIGYAELRCYETAEPFFSFMSINFHSTVHRTIIIIENKDTFWSFKPNLGEETKDCGEHRGKQGGGQVRKVDMLIYGEGRKILSSFRFIKEFRVIPRMDKIYYFGDLDAEGVNIFCELAARYTEYDIKPFIAGYLAILETGIVKGIRKTPKNQTVAVSNIKHFCSFFSPEYARRMEELLRESYYIPQEAVTANEVKKLLDTVV